MGENIFQKVKFIFLARKQKKEKENVLIFMYDSFPYESIIAGRSSKIMKPSCITIATNNSSSKSYEWAGEREPWR